MKPRQWLDRGAGLAQWALDLAFPPRCPSCSEPVEAQGNFCTTCFGALKHISDPQCSCCGIPFAFDVGAGTQCPECLSTPPAFDSVRAALVYDETSAPLIRALKFHDRYGGIPRAVRLMQAASASQREGVDMVIAVPLHWRRLVHRRYNQSALLAFALARQLAIPCLPNLLQRTRHTTPQMRLPRAQRLKNVRNTFTVPVAAQAVVRDKTILLVDDVVTTGATVDCCARLLKDAGARAVHVVALARTVKE